MNPKLEINGKERKYPQEVHNLEKMLFFTMDKEIPKDELIVEVKVNGEVYSEKFDHQARELDLKEDERVEITTQKKAVLAQEFLTQAPNYLSYLEKGFVSAARLLRNPVQEESGYELLARSLDALLAFKNHLSNADYILRGNTNNAMTPFWERFEDLSNQILQSQEDMNSVAIADLLETRIVGFLRDWSVRIASDE